VVVLAQEGPARDLLRVWVPEDGALVRLAGLRGGHEGEAPPAPVTVALDGPEPAAQVWREWLTIERASNDGEIAIHFPLTVGTERIGVLTLCFAAASRPSESL
jgi:hypothetical protein